MAGLDSKPAVPAAGPRAAGLTKERAFVLRALQHVYANRQLTTSILDLIADDIIGDSHSDTGLEGMDYWHICVLVAVRLGCNSTYDQLQDLAENHRSLRAIMGLGECDDRFELLFWWGL